MSNNINRIRKNKLKGTGIFAAAALTAALIAGNNIPGVTRQVSAAESQENTVSSLIPDSNVAKILYPELTFLSLYRIIKYYSFKNIFKKEVIIHAG